MSVTTENQESVRKSVSGMGRIRLGLVLAALLVVMTTLTARVDAAPSVFYGGLAGLVGVLLVLLLQPAARGFWRDRVVRRTLADLRRDPSPHFIMAEDGTPLGETEAAFALVPRDARPGLQSSLALFLASPESTLAGLRQRAVENGTAAVSIRAGSENWQLVATRRRPGLILCRVERSERGGPQTGAPIRDVDRAGARDGTAPEEGATSLEDAVPVAILRIAGDGSIRSANRAARTLLSLDGPDLPAFYDIVEGIGRPVSHWIKDALDGRGLNRPEIMRSIVQGRELYLQVTLGRVECADEALVLATFHDATEMKSLEAQFVQSQKMQAIGQLAGGVAHDFNNLLTAISGHCDLLLLRHDEGDPDYADLMQISQNANRAASLVGQLLAFSRKQTMKAQVMDLGDTMSDLTHLLNRLVGEKIGLGLNVGALRKVIRADRRQFEQVIMNLVVNARDAMPDGGEIRIDVDECHLATPLERDRATVPAGAYITIRVSDNGVGIGPDALPKIFEPFYTTKKTGEGTGLGLSTAYGIVKQTGGFIFAESTVGEGSCFTLYFPASDRPVHDTDASEKVGSRPRIPHGEGMVLLVEDEAPVRAFAARALRMKGYTVIEAGDAEEALARLREPGLRVDLFVTDVIMPGMDGPSWVREALKDRPETRVVFVSGYAEESLAESQSRVPNSVFLAKPFSLSELTTVVHRQLTA